jgi:hypothetical protein
VAGDAARAGGDAGRPAPESWVQAQFGPIIDRLDLGAIQKDFLRARWQDQVDWMERKSAMCQWWYYRLRLTSILGGVAIPALVGVDIAGTEAAWLKWVTFGLGLLVALATAVEGFFQFGNRWRHYRMTVELLKSEGWQFFQRSGPYAESPRHVDAYPIFAARVESLLSQDVETFLTRVTQETGKEQQPAS